MASVNRPVKSLQATLMYATGIESLPWYNPAAYPDVVSVNKDYKWRIGLDVSPQSTSSNKSRKPGVYTGNDVSVGDWIANTSTGQAWEIIQIDSKNDLGVVCIVQDTNRYNTYKDASGTGNGAPSLGIYVIFTIGDTGLPDIDPVPPSGISSSFNTNLAGRFQSSNIHHNLPIHQSGHSFNINDVISVDPVTKLFVKSSTSQKNVIGRISSVSDTHDGWFTIDPVQKVVNNLNFLPGSVGDVIYSPDGTTLSTTKNGPALYVKLRNNTQSISVSTVPNAETQPGSSFKLNNEQISVSGIGTLSNVATAVNSHTAITGVSCEIILSPTEARTLSTNISSIYGEPALYAADTYAEITINGVSVVFSITSNDAGYEDYARPVQMAESINAANVPNIIATTESSGTVLVIKNVGGGPINIVNIIPDKNGINVAGTQSATGISLNTPTSTSYLLKFTANDARPIEFANVHGTVIDDLGLVSVDNGIKAAGMYAPVQAIESSILGESIISATDPADVRVLIGAQSVLENGVSIKTINNQTLLGSGNIDVGDAGPYYEVGNIGEDPVIINLDALQLTGMPHELSIVPDNSLIQVEYSTDGGITYTNVMLIDYPVSFQYLVRPLEPPVNRVKLSFADGYSYSSTYSIK